MVSRDDAEPASRIDGLDGGAGRESWIRAGLEGRGARCGSGRGLAAGFGTTAGGGVCLPAGRAWSAGRFEARVVVCLVAGFAVARRRGAWPRACDGFLDGFLEELTRPLKPRLGPVPEGRSCI